MGGYPELNRELTVPHTVVLPIELYPPWIISTLNYYPGVNSISHLELYPPWIICTLKILKDIFKHIKV